MIRYSTVVEGSAVERIDFYRDDQKITLVNRFDNYTVYVELEDDDFDPDHYNEQQGVMMTFVDEEPGERVDFAVEGDLSDQEKSELIEAFQDSFEAGLEQLGWTWSDREVWFYGPINKEQQ